MRWLCARGHLAAHCTPSCRCLRCGAPVVPTDRFLAERRRQREEVKRDAG